MRKKSCSINSQNGKDKFQKLYQDRSEEQEKTRLPGTLSYTESRESYNYTAKREAIALLRINATVPNYIITLHYNEEMSVKRIQELWTKHSRRMHAKGITGRAAIEITKDKSRKHPTNRVHYHIVVKDTGVDFAPLGFDGVLIEELGLYEFRFVFSFGGLLDTLTGRFLELAKVGDNTVSGAFGGAVRFHQRPVREFFSVRFFVAWFDKHAVIVTEKFPLSKKLFLTTSLFGKKEARIRHFSLGWR